MAINENPNRLNVSDLKRFNRALKRKVAKEEKRAAKVRQLWEENQNLQDKPVDLRRDTFPFGTERERIIR